MTEGLHRKLRAERKAPDGNGVDESSVAFVCQRARQQYRGQLRSLQKQFARHVRMLTVELLILSPTQSNNSSQQRNDMVACVIHLVVYKCQVILTLRTSCRCRSLSFTDFSWHHTHKHPQKMTHVSEAQTFGVPSTGTLQGKRPTVSGSRCKIRSRDANVG